MTANQIPRDSSGRILWKELPGFITWFRKTGPDLSTNDMQAAIEEMWHVKPSVGQIRSLYRGWAVKRTSQGFATAYAQRNQSAVEKQTPQEKLDREMLLAQVRSLTKRQTFYEMMGEKIIDAVRQIPKLPPVRVPRITLPKSLSEEEVVLVISDVQAGLMTSNRETGGLGEFNTAVLLDQIEYLRESVEDIMRYYPNVKKLHVWFNGDIVEGQTIFDGQVRETEINVIEQVFFCVEHFARLLHRLAARFEKIECGGVVGNHGRIGRKGELSPMTNFDYLVYKWLAERTATVPNIAWTIPETWWQVHEVQKYRFLCVHGDDTGQGTWGIPFYAVARHKHKYQEMLRRSGLAPIDYMIVGHHSEKAQFQDIICAGSWPGGTEFSIKRMQALDIPTAPFFGVHKSHGVTWRRDIQLKRLTER